MKLFTRDCCISLGTLAALAMASAIGLSSTSAWAEKTWEQKVAPTRLHPDQSGNYRAAHYNFARLDRNSDGIVSAKEWAGFSESGAKLFALLDANGDRRLSRAEVSNATSGRAVGMFAQWDANNDGFVRPNEFPKRVQGNLLKILDQNNDGGISLAEIRPGFQQPQSIAKAEEPKRRAKRQDDNRPLCWVPAIGKDAERFTLEAPVTHQKCRR